MEPTPLWRVGITRENGDGAQGCTAARGTTMPAPHRKQTGKRLEKALARWEGEGGARGSAPPKLVSQTIGNTSMTRTNTLQRYGDLKPVKLALSETIRKASIVDLNRTLADAIVLRDLYEKHHWQVSGATFRELHLMFDDHQAQQGELIDQIAERIMQLGGVCLAMGADAAEESEIPRPPRDREAPVAQLERMLTAHEIVLSFARQAARRASEHGDDGSNDLFVSNIIRLNEKQAWFVKEHMSAASPS